MHRGFILFCLARQHRIQRGAVPREPLATNEGRARAMAVGDEDLVRRVEARLGLSWREVTRK